MLAVGRGGGGGRGRREIEGRRGWERCQGRNGIGKLLEKMKKRENKEVGEGSKKRKEEEREV